MIASAQIADQKSFTRLQKGSIFINNYTPLPTRPLKNYHVFKCLNFLTKIGTKNLIAIYPDLFTYCLLNILYYVFSLISPLWLLNFSFLKGNKCFPVAFDGINWLRFVSAVDTTLPTSSALASVLSRSHMHRSISWPIMSLAATSKQSRPREISSKIPFVTLRRKPKIIFCIWSYERWKFYDYVHILREFMSKL